MEQQKLHCLWWFIHWYHWMLRWSQWFMPQQSWLPMHEEWRSFTSRNLYFGWYVHLQGIQVFLSIVPFFFQQYVWTIWFLNSRWWLLIWKSFHWLHCYHEWVNSLHDQERSHLESDCLNSFFEFSTLSNTMLKWNHQLCFILLNMLLWWLPWCGWDTLILWLCKNR